MRDFDHFSDSDESFHSFDDNEPLPPKSETQTDNNQSRTKHDHNDLSTPLPDPTPAPTDRFSPEEESSMLTQSNDLKTTANALFTTSSFQSAIQTYDRALALCPNYLDFEIAVLRSNVAACHLKLEEWREALESATKGVECLERVEPLPQPTPVKAKPADADGSEGGEVEEVDAATETRIAALQQSGHTLSEVRKLQIKLLLRRAKARTSLAGWANLQAADEDYRILLSPAMQPSLSSMDHRQVVENARKLAPRLNEAKDREMAEMMGKLKGLGNSLLKPFGLSTENFQFQKDEKTGGYSMNFDQGRK